MLNTSVHPLSYWFIYRCCLSQCQPCSSQQTSVITVLVGVSYFYQNYRLIFRGGTSSTSSSMLISRKASVRQQVALAYYDVWRFKVSGLFPWNRQMHVHRLAFYAQ